MTWYIYYRDSLEIVKPRIINGKSQADVVKELIEYFQSYDMVMLVAPPGVGKTWIALNTAFKIAGPSGKVVYNSGPYRRRQEQILNDFGEDGKYVIGDGEYFWKFSIIWGRQNFTCPLDNVSCNEAKCLQRGFNKFECPFYNAPTRNKFVIERFNCETVCEWKGVDNETWYLYVRENGKACPYYMQFKAYSEANVIVINSYMWYFETLLGRKVKANFEIIDEADVVLKEIQPIFEIRQKHIQLLKQLLKYIGEPARSELRTKVNKLLQFFKKRFRSEDFALFITLFKDVMNILLTLLPDFFTDDEELQEVLHIFRRIEHISQDLSSYEFIQEFDRVLVINVKPKGFYRKVFRSLCAKKILFVTATPPPEYVMREIYGLTDIAIVKIGDKVPGTIYLGGTFSMYVPGREIRLGKKDVIEKYINELIETINLARIDGYEPRLIIATSKQHIDLIYGRISIVIDWDGSKLKEFEEGKISEVITTRVFRSIDLPYDKCRSIVITKAPKPDINDPFIKILDIKLRKEGKPKTLFNIIYHELTKANLLQMICRALRGPGDWVWLYSPDVEVYNILKELQKEGKVTIIENQVPETRKIIKEILEQVHKGEVVVREIIDDELRRRIKYILEKYFSCIVDEIDKTLMIIHKVFENKLQELVNKLKNEYTQKKEESKDQEYVTIMFKEEVEYAGRKRYIGEILKIPKKELEKLKDKVVILRN